MSSTSRNFAAILLLLLVAVEFGGGSLLAMLTRRIPGYLDNPLRQNMFRAGHAHPGVWLVLGLVGMLYVDQTPLSAGLKTLVRVTLLVAPILVSLGFFLSVVSPKAERPQRAHQPDLPGCALAGGRGGDLGHRPVPGMILSATEPASTARGRNLAAASAAGSSAVRPRRPGRLPAAMCLSVWAKEDQS